MKKKQIVKFLNKKGKEELAISDGEAFYVLYEDTWDRVAYRRVKLDNPQSTRVKPEVRKIYEDFLETVIEKEKILNDIKKLENRNRELSCLIDEYPNQLNKAMGLLTKEEFKNRILKAFNLGSEYSCNLYDEKIEIERRHDIEKYYRGIITREEYDGTRIIVANTPKAKKEYNEILKRYSRHLPLKAEYSNGLTLEDKDWLVIYEIYTIKFNKPLTEENCNKLIEKLRG